MPTHCCPHTSLVRSHIMSPKYLLPFTRPLPTSPLQNEDTPLHYAACSDNPSVVSLLLADDTVDPNATDKVSIGGGLMHEV